jgi:hypothetical protein
MPRLQPDSVAARTPIEHALLDDTVPVPAGTVASGAQKSLLAVLTSSLHTLASSCVHPALQASLAEFLHPVAHEVKLSAPGLALS